MTPPAHVRVPFAWLVRWQAPLIQAGCCGLFVVLSSLWSPTRAFGHPEGFSGLHVTITADRMRAAITLHTRDLGTWFPPGKYPDYVADVTREMEKTVDEIVELQIDEQPLPISSVKAFLLEVGLIEIDVDYQLPASAEPVELLVWSKHLIHMPRGHQQLLFVEDRREIAPDAEHGVMRLEDVLTVERDAGAVLLPPLHRHRRPSLEPSEAALTDQPQRPTCGHSDGARERTSRSTDDRSSSRKPKALTTRSGASVVAHLVLSVRRRAYHHGLRPSAVSGGVAADLHEVQGGGDDHHLFYDRSFDHVGAGRVGRGAVAGVDRRTGDCGVDRVRGDRESVRHAGAVAASGDHLFLRADSRVGFCVGIAGHRLGHDPRRRVLAAVEIQPGSRSRPTVRGRGLAAAVVVRAAKRAV